jgi:hypothetical protein
MQQKVHSWLIITLDSVGCRFDVPNRNLLKVLRRANNVVACCDETGNNEQRSLALRTVLTKAVQRERQFVWGNYFSGAVQRPINQQLAEECLWSVY